MCVGYAGAVAFHRLKSSLRTVRSHVRGSQRAPVFCRRVSVNMLNDHKTFRVEVDTPEEGVMKVELFGEMELVDLSGLCTAVTAALLSRPTTLVFDLSRASFVPIQGLLMIGETAQRVEHVVVESPSEVPKRVCELAADTSRHRSKHDFIEGRVSSDTAPLGPAQP
jgi:hypothetical protein